MFKSQKVEEFEKIVQDKPGQMRQEKTRVVTEGSDDMQQQQRENRVIQKSSRKSVAPRFVSPLTGMIVDQGADIFLEGIIDGEFFLNDHYELFQNCCATLCKE